METVEEVLMDTEDKMDKAVTFLGQELQGIRTGKASPSLVENITVDYYGSQSRLRDISNISTPEPRLIAISPFDPSSLGSIEKAIVAADIGLAPMNDGRLIRLSIPELTEERRQELVKVAKRTTEDQRVAVRNIRREANDKVKVLQKDGKISEDDRDAALEDIQKATDAHIKKMDDALVIKEADILEV